MAAESLEVRLALSTTWVDSGSDDGSPGSIGGASSPYTFVLGTDDLDLSAHADMLQGRDVVVVADEAAGDELGDVVIGSLSGLESLKVEAPAGVIIHESLSVAGDITFAADVTFGGDTISLAAAGFDFGGPIIVSADVALAGGPDVSITSSRPEQKIVLGGTVAGASNSLWVSDRALDWLSAADISELAFGDVSHTGGISLAVGAGLEAADGVRLESSSVSVAGSITGGDGLLGGSIIIVGNDIAISGTAALTATGTAGGGEILIGGSWQNSDESIRQAVTATVEAGAVLDASATQQGDGGRIVFWSDIHNPHGSTSVAGSLRAEGGLFGGDGGRIETSGYGLDVAGITVSTLAPLGQTGEWLLDPYNITISSGTQAGVDGSFAGTANDAIINVATLEAALGASHVTVSTGNSSSAGSQAGTITVASALTSSSGYDLTLKAATDIVINADVTRSGTGGLVLRPGSGLVSGTGSINLSGGTTLSLAHGTTLATAVDVGTGGATIDFADLEVEYLIVGGGGGARRGGGGGSYDGANRALGGLGGGGTGQGQNNYANHSANIDGLANTGGGGGGSKDGSTEKGGDGGSGVVIVRYSGSSTATGGTIKENGSGTAGNFTVHTFGSDGSFELTNNFVVTIAGTIRGTGALALDSSRGTINLTGANTHTGGMTVSGGTLGIYHDDAPGRRHALDR